MTTANLARLVNERRSGWSLERDFYVDAEIYSEEMRRIFRREWIFAGHGCRIPRPGDYFVVEIDGDSLIILRDDERKIRGLFNTCRHRGSLICTQPAGHVGRLVCPYHQWTYARDGRLMACGGMPDDIVKSEASLDHAAVEEVGGLIFVSLADTPPDFEPAREMLAPQLAPHGFDRAKVAFTADYDIHANWKLVWENNRECLHCPVGHPQYIRANYDVAPKDDERIQSRIDARSEECRTRWRSLGLVVDYGAAGLMPFPKGPWYRAARTPLIEGFVTESLDGQPVAPLMGDFVEPDMGTLRLSTMPNYWEHASSDHSVATRLLPAGPTLTKAQVTWLVHQDAVEGKDYDLDRLLPFWKLTSEQDWVLCENNQRGVQSSRYRPGPYSASKEYNVENFACWYIDAMKS